jgi:hypothetical protein
MNYGTLAAPTVDPANGTYTSAVTVTMSSTQAGSVVRFTTNGDTPTASSAIYVSPLSVDGPTTVKAKAFRPDYTASSEVSRSYTLAAAPPTIDPPTGVYTSAQNVAITAASGPSGTIRYTVDGSDPTETSAAFTAPFSIDTGSTVNARSFPGNSWAPSATANAVLSFNYGTLSTPTASLAEGVYADAQNITLSGPFGAAVRYTTDGNDPTAVSNVYVGPIAVSSGAVTVKARAYHADWSPSSVLSHSYTIDATAPTINSSRFPAAVSGWHNTATTISFACEDNVGISSCSSAMTAASEGSSQELVGTATDLAGRQTHTTVTVNLDFTPPTVAITTPSPGLTTSDSSVQVTGTVSDSLSGVANTTCNGQSASLVSGAMSCNVALSPGRNDVIVAARDTAGNVTSKGVRIIRIGTSTTLGLTPTARTLLVDETATLTLTDEFGAVVAAGTWSSSDPAIVSVSVDDPPVLTALQTGSATITATKSGLTANATVTAVAGTSVSYGVTRWSINGAPGFTVAQSIAANRTDLSVPDLFSIEMAGTTTIVRGITSSGDVLWTQQAPVEPLMGDSFGGLVGGTFAGAGVLGMDMAVYGPYYTSYARFAGPDGVAGWRYEPVGYVSTPAQASDGTIYAVERYSIGVNNPNGIPVFEAQVIVLDGSSGAVRARYPLPGERWRSPNCSGTWQTSAQTLGPVVGIDGYGYLAVRRWTDVNPCSTDLTQQVGVDLLRISPAGSVTSTSIYSQQCIAGVSLAVCDQGPQLKEVFPDGVGGTLVRALYHTSNSTAPEMRLVRVHDGAVQFNNVVDADERITMIGDAATAFLGGDDVRAVDVTNWTPKWVNSNASLEPVVALPNGKAAIHDLVSGQLIEFNEMGTPGQSAAFGERWGRQTALGLWTSVSSSAALSARFSLPLNEAATSFRYLGVEGTQQNAILERSFPTRELAAIFALEHIYPASRNNNWEYGGLVCQKGNRFIWSEFVTDETQDEVFISNNLCLSNTMAARFHTHPLLERPLPSGGDFAKADENGIRGIPNYLMAPTAWNEHPDPDDFGLNSPTWVLKYWYFAPDSSSQNVCLWVGGSTWTPFYAGTGANCSTPTP